MGQSKSYLTISEMFDHAVIDVRNRGYSTTAAIEQVAEFFGVSPSRVKQYLYYGEDRGDRNAVYQRYLDHLTVEEQQVTRKLLAVRTRIDEAQRA